MKKKFWLLICLALIVVIWMNSSIQGDISNQISEHLTEILVNLFHIETDFLSVHVFVRKSAHFIEYALLGGMSVSLLTYYFKKKGIVLAILLCALIASADELIQYYTPNRNGQMNDVILDICGAICGILIILTIKKIRCLFKANQ